MPHDQSRTMKRLGLTSKDLNLHRRTFRDLNKLRIQDNTDVLAERVLQNAIKRTSNSLKQLNIMTKNVDNRVTRMQNNGEPQHIVKVFFQLKNSLILFLFKQKIK